MSETRRRWRWLGWVAVLGMIGAAGVVWGIKSMLPPPPIPVPASLSDLDPQVREYLARVAVRVSQAPRESARRSELGLAFAVNGLWEEARRSFQAAIDLGDRGPLPAMYAAVALQETGDADGGRQGLEEVVRAHPGAAPAWYRLGLARGSAGDWAGAGQAFNEVTRLAADEWRGWAGLGEVRLREGNAAEAVGPLERAIALEPFARSAYHLLGQAYQALGRVDEAAVAKAAGRGQTVTPMPDAWSVRALEHMRLLPDQFERADALLAQGRVAEAISRLREAHRYHPGHPSVTARLARALVSDGQVDAAWGLLVEARKAAPEDVGLLMEASATAAAGARAAEALTLAKRAQEVAPQSVEAIVAEANALLAAEQDAAAAVALQRALERSPENVALWVQLGDVQRFNLGQANLAWDSYQRARGLDPIHPPLLERLASLAVERGDLEWAAGLIRELKRLRHEPRVVADLEASLAQAKETPSQP